MIVFTDLDGTLLDHGSYDLEPALPAIEALRDRAVPVIPATSKTAAEVEPLMKAIGLSGPAIVENGAGVHRIGDPTSGGQTYRTIREALADLPSSVRRHYRGFGDMDVDGIMAATGLPREAAERAATRRFTEPGLFDGPDEARRDFIAALEQSGLRATQGGRFLTIGEGDHTKASRIGEIVAELGVSGPIVALGDAPNDRAMLEAADIAVIVRNPSHDGLALADTFDGRLIRTRRSGPEGWAEAMNQILNDHPQAADGERQ